jgi:alkaline phosphatase D
MTMSRRSLLKMTTAVGLAGGYLLTGESFAEALDLPSSSFQYGVAAGDPLPNGFMIWTRVTPDPSASPGSGLGAATLVRWIVTTDVALTVVVASGQLTTDPASDHTVKVDVVGLLPAVQYYYAFEIVATNERSRVGAAKTAPLTTASVASLTFGLVSCSNYEGGYFKPYGYLATRCLDFVLHVGDYTYEYGTGQYGKGSTMGRVTSPSNETISLEDYRRRQAIHKADTDLQNLHAACAWITTIDDHETADNSWRDGAVNHQPATEGAYVDRRNKAYQAYLEWMPIRPASALTPSGVTFYRSFRFGTLVELDMMDLRQFRDLQATTFTGAGSATDSSRTLIGATEQAWLNGQLDAAPGAQWRLIGNSVQFMQVDYPPTGNFVATGFGSERNTDAWDGYVVNRLAVEQKIAQHAADYDVIFLTGDIHSSWAAELPLFTGGAVTAGYQSLAVEFVCPSITSDGFKELLGSALVAQLLPVLKSLNPHVKYVNGINHGACVVQVTPDQVQTDYCFTTSANPTADERWDPSPTFTIGASYRTLAHSKQISVAPSAIVDTCPAVLPVDVPEVPTPVLLPLSAAAIIAVGAATIALRDRGAEEQTVG